MKSNYTPIGRIPSLGYKECNYNHKTIIKLLYLSFSSLSLPVDLFEFNTKVQKLGGYDCVTANRLWKSIYDDMSGHQNSTSAATIIRRHYER